MTGHAIRTTGVEIAYGSTTAVTDVDLELSPNRIHGLLGRNGAGKTSLLSALASLRPVRSGEIRIGEVDPFENERLMEDVCLIRESGDFLSDEKLRTNLDLCEVARPRFDRDYAERLLDRFGVDVKKNAASLSRGQASAFGAVVGLATRAPVTMFDEVHLGMDAPSRQGFYEELLADFAEHPRTILLSTHLISEIEHLLETVTILHEGRLLLSEESDAVRAGGATVTGPAADVDRLTEGLPVLASRDLGPTREMTVYGALDAEHLDRAVREGLDVGPVPLQDLFIHLTRTTPQEPS